MTGGGARHPTVEEAEPRSYYGRPVIKPPVWKSPDVPAYFFLGGLSGASSVLATLASATGRPALARRGRIVAAVGVTGSVAALIHDLGRPERFLNMLRVAKPTSPLSVGSWVLAAYGPLAGATAASEVTGLFPRLGRVAGLAAGAFGPVLATYTAVLVADTAVPAWHDAHRELPFVFAGGSAASAGAVGMLAAPVTEAHPARRMAAIGAAAELVAATIMERRLGYVGEPYRRGRAGRLMAAARGLGVAGGLAALAGGRSRAVSAGAGLALLAGVACTRFAVFEAGLASARDPRYTVVPQRERVSFSANAADAKTPRGNDRVTSGFRRRG